MENTPSRSLLDDCAQAVAAKQRSIQQQQNGKDAAKSKKDGGAESKKPPVQAGPSQQPAPPLPAQHLEKPGLEADMLLQPRFMAEGYKGSGKLEGLTALVTGGDSGIGRAVAVLFAREGADVAIFYLNEHADAEETKRCIEAEGRRCLLMAGDVKDAAFCRKVVEKPSGNLASSTYWSTTPPSRRMPIRLKTSPKSASTKPCIRTSTAISTWPRPPCRT